jgi:hypothetical protein
MPDTRSDPHQAETALARRRSWYAASCGLLIAALLQGCVVSQVPLFDEKDAIIEPSFTGRYTFTGLEKIPANWEVFLKDKKYVMVADPSDRGGRSPGGCL